MKVSSIGGQKPGMGTLSSGASLTHTRMYHGTALALWALSPPLLINLPNTPPQAFIRPALASLHPCCASLPSLPALYLLPLLLTLCCVSRRPATLLVADGARCTASAALWSCGCKACAAVAAEKDSGCLVADAFMGWLLVVGCVSVEGSCRRFTFSSSSISAGRSVPSSGSRM